MKKLTIVLICLITSIQVAHANLINLGPRVGVSYAKLNIHEKETKDSQSSAKEILSVKNEWSYHAGIVSRIDLLHFYVQPEILFTGSRAKVIKSRKGSVDNQEVQLSFERTKFDTVLLVARISRCRLHLVT